MLIFFLCCTPSKTPDSSRVESKIDIEQFFLSVGNESNDQKRYDEISGILDELPEDDFKEEVVDFLSIYEQWAYGRERYWAPGDQDSAGEGGYLGGFFLMRVLPNQGENSYPPIPNEDSLLYPLWADIRGRMLIWSAIENNFLTEQFFEEGRARLLEAKEAYPNNKNLQMYLGEAIPWESEILENAPDWVQHQHTSITHLMDILEFWIEYRQASDGQFGGGWGDDVEMWRWWTPLFLGYIHNDIDVAQRKLSDGIFDLPRLENGYTSILTDVEHSSEDSADSISPMILRFPSESVWQNRASRIGDLASTIWMAENNRGHLHFTSTYFTSQEVDVSQNHACDTPYHTRALQPAFLTWAQGDDTHQEVLTAWLDGWIAISEREENGKPTGIPPAAIDFPSGEVRGNPWWNPGCHYSDRTFAFPRALSFLTEAMVLAYHKTGEERYINWLDSMAQHRRAWIEEGRPNGEEGDLNWARSQIRKALHNGLRKHWMLTQSDEYNDLILSEGDRYDRYRLTGEDEGWIELLENTAKALSWNQAAYTTEVRFTDRVVKFHSAYWNKFTEAPLPTIDSELLYNMITGDLGSPGYIPLPHFRWDFHPRIVRVHVTTNQSAELYAVSDSDVTGSVRVLQQETGHFTLTCSEQIIQEGNFSDGVLALTLPSQDLCTLQLED
ncbi:MAG: hypothetical protein CL916_07430 [Deltaproteobacteria bacterium]|nr:hypothetical protein [Deltaproteobacteria bacterium]